MLYKMLLVNCYLAKFISAKQNVEGKEKEKEEEADDDDDDGIDMDGCKLCDIKFEKVQVRNL